jgi:TATA-box binding protein (TBP) (component of TFIID and TFIIIB)
VSTITAIGGVSSPVDLNLFYENLALLGPDERGAGFTYVELARKQVSHTASRGTPPASARKKAAAAAAEAAAEVAEAGPPKDGRHFDNQVTVILRSDGPGPTCMNMKVFKNGKVQITGIKRTEQGLGAIEHLVRVLSDMNDAFPGTVLSPDKLAAVGYRVCLINSDFNIGFPIRRERLYAVLRKEYDTICMFEPCIYPGVKIKYMWNKKPQSSATGACMCSSPCSGRGEGDGDGCCRKVTIAVFQSGSVIITGAHTLEQIESAYSFVVSVAERHYEAILKPVIVSPTMRA